MTDEQYKEIAETYLLNHEIEHGGFWKVDHHSGGITVWFWRESEDQTTNHYVAMWEDGTNCVGF